MRKGVLELCVLAILNQGDAYSSDIIEALKKHEIILVEGTLYPLLTRMKNHGHLTYRWEESNQGPPRKYYSITPTGKEYYNTLKNMWIDFSTSINKLLQQ
ncbi:PadR family transcriptional regulator [Thermaurantimonas aggregans]|uniref:PadR family transcriptional regulator n=1 Tax=Thermaurantimonas aggregans TaxID=2173829 RepID=A0A401XK38_9FLAO|nr:PadR family transcriptional regulator [Thermaurantimonas aggregans]MCX8148540.1 PadR family transcriptional regulator [Thermaurantimonas aggregans]GCD77386.1 PadR family transcriptional regulator [Thermaurantimonas aggregans]